MTHEQFAYWLAGVFDGEGCVSYHPKRSTRAVCIANTDPVLIHRVMQALDVLDIAYSVDHIAAKPNRKAASRIWVYGRDNLIHFYNLVPFQAPDKVEKLYAAITSYTRNFSSHDQELEPMCPPPERHLSESRHPHSKNTAAL